MNENQTQSHRKRTAQQNKSLWKFCELLADTLNDAGFEKKAYHEHIAKKGFDVPWSKDSVKEDIWDLLMAAMTKNESTTEMDTTEPSAIHQVLCREFSDKFGIECPSWPTWRDEVSDG